MAEQVSGGTLCNARPREKGLGAGNSTPKHGTIMFVDGKILFEHPPIASSFTISQESAV